MLLFKHIYHIKYIKNCSFFNKLYIYLSMNKRKRVQFDIRGGDVKKFVDFVKERNEPETVVMRDIVREYFTKINTKYND
jgi:hypothetical protein